MAKSVRKESDHGEMTTAEFEALLLRAKPKTGPDWKARIEYARDVLVHGHSPAVIAKEHGVSRQTVSRAANTFRALAKTSSTKKRSNAMIITVANHKGGVGKTTLAAHLVFRAAERGARVLAIDLDGQANLSGTLVVRDDALQYACSSADLFAPDAPIDPMTTDDPRIHLLPAGAKLKHVGEGAGGLPALFTARSRIREISRNYDVVIIDTPPALDQRVQASLAASHQLIAPLTPEKYSLEGVGDLLNEVATIRGNLNDGLDGPIYVVNMLKAQTNIHLAVIELFQSQFTLVEPFLQNRAAVAEALSFNQPVWRWKKNTPAADEWSTVTDALLDASAKAAGIATLENAA